MTMRTMSVSGSFYPAKADDIRTMIDRFNVILASHQEACERFDNLAGRAVIVPHAGWIYSGFTANIAYRILSHERLDTIVVIGPSHRVGFEGISIAKSDVYQTPLGELRINAPLLNDLQQRFALPYFPDAHREHSTEVQMPFIKYYMDDAKVIELVYAYADAAQLVPIIDYILGLNNTAVVISTDLSHYYSLENAKRLDAVCLEAIENENTTALHQGCEACGMIGVEAMLNVAKKRHMEAVLLDYRTSADASGDTSRVVGYASALFQTV